MTSRPLQGDSSSKGDELEFHPDSITPQAGTAPTFSKTDQFRPMAGDPAVQAGEPDAQAGDTTVGTSGLSKRTLTVTFKRGAEFNADEYDLIIVPYDKNGIPEELMGQAPFNDEHIFNEILMATEKFATPFAIIANPQMLLVQRGLPMESAPHTVLITSAMRQFFTPPPNFPVMVLDTFHLPRIAVAETDKQAFYAAAKFFGRYSSVNYTLLLPRATEAPLVSEIANFIRQSKQDLGFETLDIGEFEPDASQTEIGASASHPDTRPHFLADHATDEDLLGYHPYALGIAAFVKDMRTRLPLTIAIDGAWGKGKSSLMKMLRNELDPKWREGEKELPHMGWWHGLWASFKSPFRILGIWLLSYFPRKADIPAEHDERRFVTAFVNAWRHGKGTQLKAKIVSDVLTAMTARFGPDFLLRLQLRRLDRVGLLTAATKGFLTHGVTLALAVLTSAILLLVVWSKGQVPFVPETVLSLFRAVTPDGMITLLKSQQEASSALAVAANVFLFGWKKFQGGVKLDDYLKAPDYLKLAGDDAQVEEDFRRILAALKERNCHLALFVDDLDRCSPGECAAVVEALNTFFGGEKNECLFVLGMHREMVASALEVAYEKLVIKIEQAPMLAEQKPFGRRFLEKIVQFVVALPEPDENTTQKFLDALTADKKRGSLDEIKELEAAKQKEAHIAKRRTLVNRSAESFLPKMLRGSFIQKGMVDTTDALLERFEAKGLDVAQMIREADKLTDLKDRIEEIKNADENEYVGAFLEVREAIRSNPRQYKRFFNKLRFYRFLRAAEKTPIFVDACEAVLALEHPDLHYQVIKRAPSFQAFAQMAASSKDKAVIDLAATLDQQAGFKNLREKLATA